MNQSNKSNNKKIYYSVDNYLYAPSFPKEWSKEYLNNIFKINLYLLKLVIHDQIKSYILILILLTKYFCFQQQFVFDQV